MARNLDPARRIIRGAAVSAMAGVSRPNGFQPGSACGASRLGIGDDHAPGDALGVRSWGIQRLVGGSQVGRIRPVARQGWASRVLVAALSRPVKTWVAAAAQSASAR